MTAVRKSLGKITHMELGEDALGVTIKTRKGKLGILNVYLPHWQTRDLTPRSGPACKQ